MLEGHRLERGRPDPAREILRRRRRGEAYAVRSTTHGTQLLETCPSLRGLSALRMIPNKIRRGQERAKFDFSLRFLHSGPSLTYALEPPIGRATRRREVSTPWPKAWA